MMIFPKENGLLSASAIALSVALIGAMTVAQTPVQGEGDLSQGAYQRGYETRFKSEIPGQDWIVAQWRGLKMALLREPSTGAVLGKDGWVFTEEEFLAPKDVRFEAIFAQVRNDLAQRDIHLLPVIVPDKARMVADKLPYARSFAFEDRYDRVLAQLAKTGGVAVDLRPALTSDQAYLRTDTHWSPFGAAQAAQKIAQQVPDLSLSVAAFETEKTGQAPFDGDLMVFLPAGQLAERYRPAPEMIDSYETTLIGGDLFGDAPVEVALVGTSFSARRDLNFDGFLKQALQADVVNYAQQGQGPFDPMESFLEDLDKGALGAIKLVIWEIPERYLPMRRGK